jgi:hypothetical protein
MHFKISPPNVIMAPVVSGWNLCAFKLWRMMTADWLPREVRGKIKRPANRRDIAINKVTGEFGPATLTATEKQSCLEMALRTVNASKAGLSLDG